MSTMSDYDAGRFVTLVENLGHQVETLFRVSILVTAWQDLVLAAYTVAAVLSWWVLARDRRDDW